jgi:UDP-N-acetylglucosamine:LPS N-acetylglucosamine transferase
MFIASTGGHLSELLRLSPLFESYDFSVVTEKTDSDFGRMRERYGDRAAFLIFGTRERPFAYPFKLFLNCWISLALFIKFRPRYIVTTGAHTAGPMCLIGKALGAKIVFIESFANINSPSVTGKAVYKFADLFIVQWESMLRFYPKARYFGGLL